MQKLVIICEQMHALSANGPKPDGIPHKTVFNKTLFQYIIDDQLMTVCPSNLMSNAASGQTITK